MIPPVLNGEQHFMSVYTRMNNEPKNVVFGQDVRARLNETGRELFKYCATAQNLIVLEANADPNGQHGGSNIAKEQSFKDRTDGFKPQG